MSGTRTYFGTDGVRGAYGSATMNESFAWRLGAAAARFALEKGAKPGARVILGRDTRVSGASLEQALAAGLASAGLTPVGSGVVPTPAVSLAVREENAALGVVITASHNPAVDNGIKFFGPSGIKLTDDEEFRIEQLLPAAAGAPLTGEIPRVGAHVLYTRKAGALLPANSLRGWKIALDTANGAACGTSRTVLEQLGAELVLIGNQPNGQNINEGVGSQHPEKMSAAVKSSGARLGVAHDGDADRCILCDEHGEVLDGDEMLTILALHALQQGRLAKRTLVITVQSNLGVDAALAAAGGRVSRTPVGDRYVIERMLAEGATLGGESSGHVICMEVSPTGDGLVAALKVIEVMLATGRPLSDLRRNLKRFPQRTAALAVREKKPLETLPSVQAAISAVETELGSRGRVLVRYSGTEAKLRLLVEGPTDEIVKACLDRLIAAVTRDLEVV
ncbi:MAG TPA: phosphoglucosamine mutase [Candidatus Didemnitutus sp.]|nr:phosphoglucosamine mutase [Candidatus Didemnitutus sp.]